MNIIDLREILGKIPWALIGGVATRAYMPERATLDIDILVHSDDAAKVATKLETAKFRYQQRLLIPGSSWIAPNGSPIDVIEMDDEWVGEALKNTQADPQGLPTIALPYLVLMKLLSARVQDLADVSRMLGLAEEPDLDEVRKIISRYLPEATDDLNSLIQLGKMERETEDG